MFASLSGTTCRGPLVHRYVLRVRDRVLLNIKMILF